MKVSNGNVRAMCKICFQLDNIDTTIRSLMLFWCLCLTLNNFIHCSNVYAVDFDQVNAG